MFEKVKPVYFLSNFMKYIVGTWMSIVFIEQ